MNLSLTCDDQLKAAGRSRIQQIAKELRRLLVRRGVISGSPPFDPFNAAKGLGVSVDESPVDDLSGRLYRVRNRWYILVPSR